MKLEELKEARVRSNPKEQWFVFEKGDMDYDRLIGPFRTHDEAAEYSKYMHRKYAHMNNDNVPVQFNHGVHKLRSPEEYEDEIAQHHTWLND